MTAATMERAAEAATKVEQLRGLLRAEEAHAIVLTRAANFAWLSGGGRSFVNVAAEQGVAWVVVSATRVAVVTSNIEAARLAEEELAGLPWEVLSHPWWQPGEARALLRTLAGGDGGLLADGPFSGAVDVGPAVARLRSRLLAPERARAAEAGRDVAEALETVCRQLRPGDTERAVAALLAAECASRGLEPVVRLVAADTRAARRRHPLPTDLPVARYALVAVGAMRHGLVLSATRLVHFGPPDAELERRWRAAASVDAAMLAASRPGAAGRDVLAAARDAYARAGFPDEWQHHHQGGVAGYASREWRATPDGGEVLHADQLVAWNPTVQGAKSEDTALVRDEGPPRVLTRSGAWPEVEFEVGGTRLARPAILVRRG